MKKCPYCGSDLADEMRFCIYCMRSLDEKKAVVKRRKKILPVIIAAVSLAVIAVIVAVVLFVIPVLSNHFRSVSGDINDSEPGTDAVTDKTDATAAGDTVRAETDPEPDDTDPDTSEMAYTVAESTENETSDALSTFTDGQGQMTDRDTHEQTTVYVPETIFTSTAAPETKAAETTGSEITAPETTAETEPETTRHVHTDACKKWVVDTPYVPAVYKTEKVMDIPYSPAEYGDIPKQVTDHHYRIEFCDHDQDQKHVELDDLIFYSRSDVLEWKEESGAVFTADLCTGYVTVTWGGYDGITVDFDCCEYGAYTAVVYEYGLIKPEQQEVSHFEIVLVSPEQMETGHYEYVCGY